MFGKKILSLICSLFIASNFVKAANEITSDDCVIVNDSDNGDCTSGTYCLDKTSKSIYLIGSGCDSVQLGAGIHVFEVTTKGTTESEVELGSAFTGTDTNLAFYTCNSEKACRKTAGYVKINGEYFKIENSSSSKVNTLETTCNEKIGKLAEITVGGERKRTTKTGICIDGDDDNIVEFGDTGSYLVDTNSEFDSGKKIIAKVSSNDITAISIEAGKNYIITDKAGLVEGSEGKTIIIDSDVQLNSELMAWNKNYCVYDDMSVWERKDDLCNSSKVSECTYYNCGTGECEKNEKTINPALEVRNDCDIKAHPENCVANTYYLIKESTMADTVTLVKSSDGDGTYYLVFCSKASHDSDVSCDIQTSGSIPIGYLVNSGASSEYIACDKNEKCISVSSIDSRLNGITGESKKGKHMIGLSSKLLEITGDDTSNSVIVKYDGSNYLIDENDGGYYITTTSQSLVQNDVAGDLYNCEKKTGYTECGKVTTGKPIGYLVNSGNVANTPYIKCNAAGSCAAYSLVSGCTGNDDSNYGDLYDNSGSITLCKVKNDETELVLKNTGAVTGKFFASVATGKSLFGIEVKDGYNVVLNFTDGKIVVDNDPIKYRYTKKVESKIESRTSNHSSEAGGICHKSGSPVTYDNVMEYILAKWDGATDDLTDGVAYYVNEKYDQ